MTAHTSPAPTAPVVAAGLVGGYAVARYSGRRELGGLVLAAAGVWCGRSWTRTCGPGVAAALLATYVGAFGGSHPLAKQVGAWPAVGLVTGPAAATTYVLADRPARATRGA